MARAGDEDAVQVGRVANVAGASGGTGIIAIAQLLPQQDSTARALLSFMAPVATVILASTWPKFRAWLSRQIDRTLWRIEINGALTEARKHRDNVLADPQASSAHKRTAQQNVERLELIVFEMIGYEASLMKARFRKDASV